VLSTQWSLAKPPRSPRKPLPAQASGFAEEASQHVADLNTFQSGISGNLKNDPIEGIGPELIGSIYSEAFQAAEPAVAAAR